MAAYHLQPQHKQSLRRGVTLLELLLALAVGSIILVAIPLIFRATHDGWRLGERRVEVIQNVRIAGEHTARFLREARRITAISAPSDSNGYIQYYDKDYVEKRLELSAGWLRYGEIGSLEVLAGPASGLTFAAFDAGGNQLADPVDCSLIRSISISITITDAQSVINPKTVASRVYLMTDASGGVVVNEIMQRFSVDNQTAIDWVELYNAGGQPTDVGGWKLSTPLSQASPGALSANVAIGGSSTVIPAGQYAIVVGDDSNLFTIADLLEQGGFEPTWTLSNWVFDTNNANTGTTCIDAINKSGATAYQTLTLPANTGMTTISWWAKATTTTGSLVVTIKNAAGTSTLVTLDDGSVPLTTSYVQRTVSVDLSAYANSTVRLYFTTAVRTTYYLDDVSMVIAGQNVVRQPGFEPTWSLWHWDINTSEPHSGTTCITTTNKSDAYAYQQITLPNNLETGLISWWAKGTGRLVVNIQNAAGTAVLQTVDDGSVLLTGSYEKRTACVDLSAYKGTTIRLCFMSFDRNTYYVDDISMIGSTFKIAPGTILLSVSNNALGGWLDADSMNIITLTDAGTSSIVTVEQVNYLTSIAENGKSIERVSAIAESSEPSNWAESTDPDGSTAGRKNSVTP